MNNKVSRFIAAVCLALLTLSGCGSRKSADDYAMETYNSYRIKESAADNEADYVSGYAGKAEAGYYRSMDELTSNDKKFDMSEWEGDTWWEKISLKLLYYFGQLYGNLKFYYPIILIANCTIGLTLFFAAPRNNQIRRFGIFNMCIYMNLIVTIVVIGVGMINSYYIGS